MLVVSRQKDECIEIGKAGDVLTGPICVTLLSANAGRARIGIGADPEIGIYRGEVADKIRQEVADAARAAGSQMCEGNAGGTAGNEIGSVRDS